MKPLRKDLAAALGIAPSMVTKLADRGMPTDSVEAARQWRADNLAAHRTKQGRVDTAARAEARPGAQRAGRAAAQRRESPYLAARTQRELIDTETARLQLMERRKVLVHRDTVRAEISRHLSTLREALLQLPVRLQSVLAQEQDEAKVHDLLQDEVHLLLERISAITAPDNTPTAGAPATTKGA